ncbi:hypothetical protein DU475_06225 [Rhodopseudomonas sp. WA056]|uniref:hypothetical protein n=1 Tax=Rhodopseudomonas sp. WA056 TaxID=2269367 RepID=UPI0013DFFEC8|nr:hypothetical protein [Rhodopseudomonas sp. WA056]NEW86860.1 hypothetical protein [Rhodopseudomonas sp. WA056]
MVEADRESRVAIEITSERSLVIAPPVLLPAPGVGWDGRSFVREEGEHIAAARVDTTGDHRMDGAWE